MKAYRNVINLEPDDVETWLHLSILYQRKGELENALNALEKAVSIDKKFVLILDEEEDLLESLKNLAGFKEIMDKY